MVHHCSMEIARLPAMKYLFGPVNSRRLGKSLGIDLLPFKTCSLDCIYCECGWTTTRTLERREWVPTDAVQAELDSVLASHPDIDYVTFSGSGEPTLHSGIGRVITHLKTHYPQHKVAVLTNATLLGDKAVQAELHAADLVVPSLDAATRKAFARVCRPVRGVHVEKLIDGIAEFRQSYPGLMLLEVFIAPGINDSEADLAALKAAAERIAPDAIQLNSLDRPAPEPGLVSVASSEQIEAIRAYLHPLQVQIVRKRAADEPAPWDSTAIFREILAVIDKGISEITRLAVATGIREGDLAKTLQRMAAQQLVIIDGSTGAVQRRY
jgi:wyosine [tRNA(Phe)-imidazoG37] synthetase (radical SAM superfamily)